MGIFKKIFGADPPPPPESVPVSTRFEETETTEDQRSRNAPKRELVHVVLRETMRKHGIPSDWIEVRVLSVSSRSKVPGLHVQIIVRQGEERLLAYVHAFQDSFRKELEQFEPRFREWLLSLTWEFQTPSTGVAMPGPSAWGDLGPASGPGDQAEAPAAPDTVPAEEDEEVMRDVQALFAIRDAAFKDDDTTPGSR